MNVKPLRDFVVVSKEASTETKSPAGLVLMPTSTEKVTRGTVLAVGSGWVSSNGAIVPLEVKVGDQVTFNSSHATEVKSDDGTTVFLLREEQLFAVIS